MQAQPGLRLELESLQLAPAMNHSSNFGDRIAEFGRKLDTVARVKNDAIDAGDAFKALDRYVVTLALCESIKDLFDADQNSPIKTIEEQYEEKVYNNSGLAQILENLDFNGINLQNQSSAYSQNVSKVKVLLSIYTDVMKMFPGHQSNADKKELETATALVASATPIPGAPTTWCTRFFQVLFYIVVLVAAAMAARDQ